MSTDLRLPHTQKEGLIYGIIICSISVLVMTSLNIIFQFQRFDSAVLLIILKSLPLFFILAFVIEHFVVSFLAAFLVAKFSLGTDGFNAHLLFTILFTVLGMSIILSLIGSFIGHGFSLATLTHFLAIWPRNFALALWLELLIAQPLARRTMSHIHRNKN